MKLAPLLFLVGACCFAWAACILSLGTESWFSLRESPLPTLPVCVVEQGCRIKHQVVGSKGHMTEIQRWDFCRFCWDFYLNNISLGILAIVSIKSSPEDRAITGENRTKRKRNTKSYWNSFRLDPAMPEGSRSIPGFFTLLANKFSFCLTQVWVGLYLPEIKLWLLKVLLSQGYLEEAI